MDRGERLEEATTNHKDEAIANESCIGRRMTEQRSRLSRRKRGRRQGVEDQRQTCKALSRSGGGLGYVRVCAWTAGAREKAHKLEERAPCSQAGAGGLRKSRFSRTCEREQKDETREALASGDGHGLSSGDEGAVLALAAFLKVRS